MILFNEIIMQANLYFVASPQIRSLRPEWNVTTVQYYNALAGFWKKAFLSDGENLLYQDVHKGRWINLWFFEWNAALFTTRIFFYLSK